MTIPSLRSLILWISVFSITSPSADFGHLRKTSEFFGNLRKWSCHLQKSQHSQGKNITVMSQKKLAGIHSYSPVVPSKTIPYSRPKWAKCSLVFRPKRTKNPTLWGGTYLYDLYKGVHPPPPGIIEGIHQDSVDKNLVPE